MVFTQWHVMSLSLSCASSTMALVYRQPYKTTLHLSLIMRQNLSMPKVVIDLWYTWTHPLFKRIEHWYPQRTLNTLKSFRIILKQFLKWERACIHDQKQHFINTDFQEIFSYTLEPYFYLQCHVWGIESAEQNVLIRLILICYLHFGGKWHQSIQRAFPIRYINIASVVIALTFASNPQRKFQP